MAEKDDVNSDLHYLKLLSIFHYIVGGLIYLVGCFLLFPMIFQIVMFFVQTDKNGGYKVLINHIGCFVVFLFIAAGLTLATLVVITGRKLAKQKSYTFCMIIGALECVFATLLGVLTIILLSRPGVNELFKAAPVVPPEN